MWSSSRSTYTRQVILRGHTHLTDNHVKNWWSQGYIMTLTQFMIYGKPPQTLPLSPICPLRGGWLCFAMLLLIMVAHKINILHLHVNLVEWCYSFNLLHVPSLLDTMTLMPSCRLFTCSIAPFQNINYIWCICIQSCVMSLPCVLGIHILRNFFIWNITLLTLNKILQYCRYII